MNFSKKLFLLFIIPLFFVAVTIGVANWNIVLVTEVVPNSCFDSDGDDWGVKGNTSALIVVSNYWPLGTNSTIPVTIEDKCEGDILMEGACGSTYGYHSLGGILGIDCKSLGNYSCFNGACVYVGGNSTNQTFPLIALWSFDEGNGTTTFDSSGNGNTGTLQNGVQWTNNSYFGNALSFDGVDDFVTTLHTSSIDVTQKVEIEAWVKRNSLSYGTIVSKNGPYYLAIYNDTVRGGVYANDGNCPSSCTTPGANTWTEISGTTNLQVGVWYKLRMRYDGNTVKVYVNDVEENSAPKIGQMPQVSQNLHIGWGEPGQNYYFNGIVDEVVVRGF